MRKFIQEADLREGRVPEGSSATLQLEPRWQSTLRDRHPRGRRSWRDRLQGARSPGSRAQRLRQVETFEECEIPRAVERASNTSLERKRDPWSAKPGSPQPQRSSQPL